MIRSHNKPWADAYFTTRVFARCSLRTCTVCKHAEIYNFTGGHRGAGMVGGNKARGRMIQHIKSAHPELAPKKPEIIND